MKRIIISLFLLINLGFIPENSADTWQLKKFESGISIYTRNAENSKFKELKSVATYKSSLSGIIALIDDFETYPQWVYRRGKSTTLKKISEKECIHYQTVTAPWPIVNRDFVVNVKLIQDQSSKIVIQETYVD